MCKTANMPLISSAATGVAAGIFVLYITSVCVSLHICETCCFNAGQMHEAGTNHSKWALPVYNRKEQDTRDFLPPLSRTTVRNLLEEYEDGLASGSPLAVAIDEVSMLDGVTFGRILRRIEEFEKDYFDTTPPRLFILVGNVAYVHNYRKMYIYFIFISSSFQEISSKYHLADRLLFTALF